MTYVEGFVLAVPAANKEEFRTHAAGAVPLFKEFGATRLVEGWGDDVPDGKITDYTRAAHAKPDETVVFSWIEWPSKAVRDVGMKASMEDERMKATVPGEMPFDGMRMIFGGFVPIVDA